MASTISNTFHFLEPDYPLLAKLGQTAAMLFYIDAPSSAAKCRIFAERLTEIMFRENRLTWPRDNTLAGRIRELHYADLLPGSLYDLLEIVRRSGNAAAHGDYRVEAEDARVTLESTFKVAQWFQETYGATDTRALEAVFVLPEAPPTAAAPALTELEDQLRALESRFQALQVEKNELEKAVLEARQRQIVQRGERAAKSVRLSEAETRRIIDEKLRLAGWEADTEQLRFQKGTRPEANRNLAIAEWPCGQRRADYALFIGTTLYALVEAKAQNRNVYSDLIQARNYAKLVEPGYDAEFLGHWEMYRVPFIFSTNGREYHPQVEQESGIWFHDLRQTTNQPKALQQWFPPQGLRELLDEQPELAGRKLESEPFDYLQNPHEGLGLRDYQVDAIRAVEQTIARGDTDRALIAMATGTGKTRTVIGLVYRLLKSRRFRRILFLVDRNLLGEQAKQHFTEYKVEDFQSLSKIYPILGYETSPEQQRAEKELTGLDDSPVKVHFATVQSMVRRIYDSPDPAAVPLPNTYDCIIVDEAHRGYLLDREMDEDQLSFRSFLDFVSKYTRVLRYFHAFRVGLTATPAPHTAEIFGPPVYEYTYRQAVVDGYLIDHEPPIRINTKLNQEGIVWTKGEKPLVKKSSTGEILELEQLEDDLHIDVEGFNRKVITEDFNYTVCTFLTDHIDPNGPEKTLVFAVDDKHADMVVQQFFKAYQARGWEVDHRAIAKITGQTEDLKNAVSRYKNETYPTIAVTVDLLTTGIDVPAICNLVFLRRVGSRILYEQMLGRATRRCDDIGKEVFRIYDAVRLYEALEDFTNMKPVAPNPGQTFTEAAEALARTHDDPDAFEQARLALLAKLQRKRQALAEDTNASNFSHYTGQSDLGAFVQLVRALAPEAATAFAAEYAGALAWLDTVRGPGYYTYISTKTDELREPEVGYGPNAVRPEDFIASFREFIINNRNRSAALQLVVTRPRDLTREALKQVKLELDRAGFSRAALDSAARHLGNNAALTADIIAHIRSQALGSDLESQTDRVRRAMGHIYALRNWTPIQRKWLQHIENQLLQEAIINRTVLDDEPFRSHGGYKQLSQLFHGELDTVIDRLNEYLYSA